MKYEVTFCRDNADLEKFLNENIAPFDDCEILNIFPRYGEIGYSVVWTHDPNCDRRYGRGVK